MYQFEKKYFKTGIWLQVILILILTLVIFFAAYYQPGKSCTIFTAVQGDQVLYGNSEDQHNPDPVIGFFPPTSDSYGSVHFGITRPDGQYNFEGAVNDQGLAWDCNSTPKTRMAPDPNSGKPYYLGDNNFLTRITKKAATVEEAIRIAKLYQFGDSLAGQYHIADASGAAVVISAGPDGKIAFTRKEPGDDYHLSTNFNLAQPEKGPVDFRWDTASDLLSSLEADEQLTPNYAVNILEDVHLKTLTTYTLYSNVLDLRENKIYLNYMAQFQETALIDMEEEFSKGQRVMEMRDFFSPETAAAGDAAYQRFAIRFQVAKISVITVAILLIIGMVFLIIKKLRKRKQVPLGTQ
jgi:hypothetical protein